MTVPAAPAITEARPNGVGVIRLRFTAVDGATSYKVYRRSGGGAYALIQTLVAPAVPPRAYDGTVVPGTRYVYKVLAHNASGDSLASNEIGVLAASTVVAPSPTGALRRQRSI